MYIYVTYSSADFLAVADEVSQICAEFNKNNYVLKES